MSGRPFERGNKAGKGRPPGSRNKKGIFLDMLEDRGEAIITKGIFMALSGDRALQRLCIERLIPMAQPPPTRFRLPKNKGELDLKELLQSVLKQTASGCLSPQQALDLAAFAETCARTVGNVENEKRIAAMEAHDAEEDSA
jgi:hypothetical protein